MTVEASWERNRTLLEDSDDGRITVISTGLAESPYQTRVRFNATDFEDAGIYNCSARITPRMPEFILEETGFVTRAITVLSKYSTYCTYMSHPLVVVTSILLYICCRFSASEY